MLLSLAVGWRHFCVGFVSGQVPAFEDVGAYFVPLWSAAARAMKSGHLPTWSLTTWSGQPLLGDPQLGVLYPLHWLWLAIGPLWLYPLSIVLHAVIAALGVVALLRERGRSHLAAATAAIATALGAFFVMEARHEMFIASAAWVPWLLWAIARHARLGSRIPGIALTFALALLAGGWSMLVFAAPVVVVFALARTERTSRRITIGIGLALGVGLALVQLVPALAHARLSPRALPLAPAFAGSYAWPSLRYAATLLFPLLYGDDALRNYHGAPDQWELSGYGVGAIAAAFVVLALLRRRGRSERFAYVALLGVAMLLALGPNGPLWPLARTLPLIGRARCPARALFVYTCFAPLLVGDGVDALRAWLPRVARPWLWLAPTLVALELVLTFSAQNPTVEIGEARLTPAVLDSLPIAPTPDGRTLVDVHLGQAFHNAPARWNLESPGGYSSLPLWRYLHFLYIANHGHVYPGSPKPELADDLSAQGLWTLSSPLVDLLNVRWALVPRLRTPDGSGWHRVIEGRDLIDLWANDEALPRAFVLTQLRSVADEGAAAEAIARADFDPREAIIEEPSGSSRDASPFFAPAQVLAQTGDTVVLVARAPRPALLVLGEPHDPSWRVRVDGQAASLLRVDYALMGVRFPPGTHTVTFERVDLPLRVGALGTLLSLLACSVLALRQRGEARRRPREQLS